MRDTAKDSMFQYVLLFLVGALLIDLGRKKKSQDQEDNPNSTTKSSSMEDTQSGKPFKSGYQYYIDRHTTSTSNERTCFDCSNEGKKHPIEFFVQYPCCGHFICLDCIYQNGRMTSCGECITLLPQEEKAILFLDERLPTSCRKALHHRMLGRSHRFGGVGTCLDELTRMPVYQRMPKPCPMLALMSPTNVWMSEKHFSAAARDGDGNTYNTDFPHDPFPMDKELAEYWFQRALGKGNKICALAFTRYGEFLMWERRFQEAREKFQVAAIFGHAQGQYEFAKLLLKGLGKDSNETVPSEAEVVSNEEMTEAIEWLCKASVQGYYIPSYTLLAQTLIQISEKTYGTPALAGKSHIPRAIQILNLVETGEYGNSNEVKKEAEELLARYNCTTQCSNCGAMGSESNPLLACNRCNVTMYCSKICQRKDYRQGHKFDCCDHKQLFDFHSIKIKLPWINSQDSQERKALPMLQALSKKTLSEMVDDDTDEIYGEEELDYDEFLLSQLMLRMRKNLETYLDRTLGNPGTSLNLEKKIKAFAARETNLSEARSFVHAMQEIRRLGNDAAHRSPNSPKPSQQECDEAVRDFRKQKQDYEIVRSRAEQRKPSISEVSTVQDNTAAQNTTDNLQKKQKRKKKEEQKEEELKMH
eukprot:CAMPEP_0113648144 /NCGR_PEP_ID=MMETSP0017_2-20120614/25518_1 /TAXON_ID=2856 /ORGANISM="Cylindrotheca closterium" /LENGTH=642 /DNA_ID=CAMNT_0000560309 /DNA_START=111 /DNA_END=2040 /DNA_ORIENTATION=+ /assembly_acc=CAM_ASM_000147